MKKWKALAAAVLSVAMMGKSAQGQATKPAFIITGNAVQKQPKGVRLEKAAYLGVTVSLLSPALREQLKLTPGIGVVVDRVEPDSPAAQAGVEQYDILQKMDDQWLIDSYQLATLIRTFAPGRQVTLTLIHQDQTHTTSAALVEKEVPVIGPEIFQTAAVFPDSVSAGQISIGPGGPDDIREHLKSMAGQLSARKFMVVTNSGGYSLKFQADGANSQLTITDADGTVVFDGPVDTTEERQAVPPKVMERVKAFMGEMDSLHLTRTHPVTRKSAP